MDEIVFASSGSTGIPKRIVRRLDELKRDAAALAEAFRPTLGEAAAFVASIREEHLYGRLWRDLVPAALDVPVDAAVVTGVEELGALAARYGRIVFVTTPSFLEKALAHPDFAALKGAFADIVTSGSALRTAAALAVKAAVGVAPLEIYGSTESGTVGWRRQDAGTAEHVFTGVELAVEASGRLIVTASPYAMCAPCPMGDNARLLDDGRFELLGRADRLVKILEEFVALGEVERAFAAHPFIEVARAESYGEAVPRLGLVAVLTAAGRAELVRGGFAAVLARLRADVRPTLGVAAYPRRLRFVRELPCDGRGKTTAAAIRAVLTAKFREPAVTMWRATDSELVMEMIFPADHGCFDGHFPGFPVLAGVVQLFFLRRFARQNFADFPDAGAFTKLKFRRLVRPGETLHAEVRRAVAGRFEISLSVDGEIATSATLSGNL